MVKSVAVRPPRRGAHPGRQGGIPPRKIRVEEFPRLRRPVARPKRRLGLVSQGDVGADLHITPHEVIGARTGSESASATMCQARVKFREPESERIPAAIRPGHPGSGWHPGASSMRAGSSRPKTCGWWRATYGMRTVCFERARVGRVGASISLPIRPQQPDQRTTSSHLVARRRSANRGIPA
jgi:hypothetical protein